MIALLKVWYVDDFSLNYHRTSLNNLEFCINLSYTVIAKHIGTAPQIFYTFLN